MAPLLWSIRFNSNRRSSWPYKTLAKILDYFFTPQNPVLCGLGNTKFDDGLGWNLDLLLRLWIKTRARFPLLLHQLAETGQDKFAILFNLFIGERAKSIQEYGLPDDLRTVSAAISPVTPDFTKPLT
jgi:hypothetical protein